MFNGKLIIESNYFGAAVFIVFVYVIYKTYKLYSVLYRGGVLRKFLLGRMEYIFYTWFNPIRAGVITVVGLIYCYLGKFHYPVDGFIVLIIGFYSITGYYILLTGEADDRRYKVLAVYQYVIVFILLIYLGMPNGSLLNGVFGPLRSVWEQSSVKGPSPSGKSLVRQLIGDLYSHQLAPRHSTLASHIIETKNSQLQTLSKLMVKDEPVTGLAGVATVSYLVIRGGTAALCSKVGICTPFGPLAQMKQIVQDLEGQPTVKYITRKKARELGFFKSKFTVEEFVVEQSTKLTEGQAKIKAEAAAQMKGILKNIQPSGWRMRALTIGVETARVVAAGMLAVEAGAVATAVVSKVDVASVDLMEQKTILSKRKTN